MEKKYSVTYKVAKAGAEYVYQQDKADHKAGDSHSSTGGHMWYALSDGVGESASYGFESKFDEMRGPGQVGRHDNAGYKETVYEVSVALTEAQYKSLLAFSENPASGGFDNTRYRLLTNSCVDFVYASLKSIGFNGEGFEGALFPADNIKPVNNLLHTYGAQIIRDDLTRHGEYYEAKDGQQCLWLGVGDVVTAPQTSSLINIDINPSPQPQQHIQGESKAQQDVANGFIQNSATNSIFAVGGILNKTDFTSTQMSSLASGGIRPGEMQLDPNARPNTYLSNFYQAPDSTKPDFSLRNAVTLNGLSAMTTFNTYVDPLLLDLTGNGVHMTDIRDGVLFDTDHSGTLKRSGWADRSTGMLVIDDGSGQIKDVSQMFSEYYGGKAGVNGAAGEAKFKDGFAALASEDANKDGVIDQRDPIWSKLRVWVDGTHDAKVDGGELKTLAELGITQINVRAAASTQTEVRDGNRVLATGSFTINGKSQEALAVDFLGDPVSNTLSAQGAGTKVTSTSNGITTTAYASQSTTGETLDAAQLGVGNLYGGSGNDTLIAAPAGGWLVGGGGSNTYVGGKGDDVFVVSASDDMKNLHGNGGHDTAIVVGDKGVVLNMAQAGLTIAQGGSGDDTLISGGSGSAFIKGGSGNSTLVGGAGSDVLVGGSGHNTIIGGSGKAVIYAGPQGDVIYAAEGGSIIHAGGGADRIFGGAGNDVIEVGHGNATIDGDGGINLVTLHGNHGDYRITRTASGYEVADKVAGRDGTVTLKNIQKLNFSDISAVDLQTPNAMPVADVLSLDQDGKAFNRTQPHLIAAQSLLANDQHLNSQGALRIANVGDAVGGSVSLTAQGDVLFTPDAHYTGLLSFKYGVVDAAGNLSASVVDLSSGQTAPMRAGVTLLTPEVPLDPLAAQEWYLSDTNVLPVWQDYTGKGVRIGQFEPGGQFATAPEIFDIAHPDLAANVDQAWLQTQQSNGSLPGLVSNHATMVAGVMVAAKNGTGGVGVAYGATLGGYYLANSGADLAGLGHMVSFDIANNSWGFTNDFALSSFQDGFVNTATALSMNAQYAASNGRGGLGTIIVAAGGNSRATGGNAQGSLTNNNRFSVEVGAINAQGDLSTLQIGSSPFSNPGASLLVSAPGSNVVSTSHMLETDRGSTFGNDYTSMQGTSFAAPIVSGIVALMLEANPNLGYRDVQQILALSARQINDPSTQWSDNAAHHWNGGGMHTSNDYGFGEVDARAAVRLAEAWMTQSTGANEYVYSASSGALGKNLAAGGTLSSSIAMNAGLNVEHVEIDFDAQVGRLGDLTLKLISPDGTQSVLLNRQGKVPDGMPGASATDLGSTQSGSFKYTFMTTHDFGERSAGNWTLQVSDSASGLPVTLNAWSLRLYGSKSAPDDTYFYTDEYLKSVVGHANRGVLDDAVNGVAGGRNTLNAAAVSGDSSINLLTGVASLGGAALTVKNPPSIQNIVTGDGNDVLVAGNADALLDGGRGNNSLTGGAGKDFFVVHRRDGGSDVINHFEAARGEIIDLVGFAGKKFTDLVLSQQGADVKIDLAKGQSIVLKNQSLAGIGAANFKFQDTFVAPTAYVNSDASAVQPQEGLGTVLLNGGGKGVMYSSDAQGKMVASLSGTIYSHDSATSDVFVVAAQSGVKDYNNALRGFRHGIDKIDLRQTGVTDFSQLTLEHKNRATLNGLTQIHGVYVTRTGAQGADSNVNLLYLDALDVAQVSASDFIFAEHAPDVVTPVGPVVAPVEQPTVTVPGTLTPIVERPGVDKPVVVPPLPPVDLHPTVSVPVVDPVLQPSVTIPDITLPEHKTIEQILAERGIDLNPKVPEHKTVEQILAERGGNQGPTVPEHKTIEQILAERGIGSLQPSKLPDIGPVGRDQGGRTPVDVPSPRPIVIPDIPVVDTSHRDLDIVSRPRVTVPDFPTASDPRFKFDDPLPSVTDTEDFSYASIRDRIRSRPTPTTVDPVTSSSRDPLTLSPLPSVDPAPVASDPNTMTVKGFFANVSLGDESKTINVEASSAKLVAGNGDNKVNVTGSRAEITLGNGNNVIAGDINKLTVGHGNNSITDSGSFATVKLGDGNNKVLVSGSMPTVEVGHGVNDLEFSGSMGQLVFGQDISPERLWFQHEGQDLQISVIGSQQEVTLHNWYAATPERPRDIMTGDRHRLLGNDVENLVQAMAAFAPAAPATMTFGAAEQQALQPVLAANWT
ncbi:Regulatory P domain of the subtilisin-like proprotein convertases and other proteases [Pseudomonas sp. LAMO17WK12:I10]|nr:hemolysin type calcium-binding protein [Pseudomonas sp. LAMO17WK12:I9]SNY51368.1 Regulatory P domain of the subtilisin-like proprotein convertases and other proteases [Pseudomonas sp. LAMO17WK12:I10]